MRHTVARSRASVMILALVGLLGLGITAPTSAFAEDAPAAEEPMALTMEETGSAKLDGVFGNAKTPIETLDAVRLDVKGVNTGLVTALGLKEGTPFKDALADLQAKAENKVNVSFESKKMPTFKAEEGVPENVQAAIDSLNASFGKLEDAEDKLTKAGEQLVAVATEAGDLATKPPKELGIKATQIPKVTKATNANVKTLKGGAEVTKELVTEIGTLLSDVKGAFGG